MSKDSWRRYYLRLVQPVTKQQFSFPIQKSLRPVFSMVGNPRSHHHLCPVNFDCYRLTCIIMHMCIMLSKNDAGIVHRKISYLLESKRDLILVKYKFREISKTGYTLQNIRPPLSPGSHSDLNLKERISPLHLSLIDAGKITGGQLSSRTADFRRGTVP